MVALTAQLRQASLPHRKRIRRLRRQLELSCRQIAELEAKQAEQSERFAASEAERTKLDAERDRLATAL